MINWFIQVNQIYLLNFCFLTSFCSLVECLVALGYKREDIEASLSQTRYDDVHATYLLISRKNTDVSNIHELCKLIV